MTLKSYIILFCLITAFYTDGCFENQAIVKRVIFLTGSFVFPTTQVHIFIGNFKLNLYWS